MCRSWRDALVPAALKIMAGTRYVIPYLNGRRAGCPRLEELVLADGDGPSLMKVLEAVSAAPRLQHLELDSYSCFACPVLPAGVPRLLASGFASLESLSLDWYRGTEAIDLSPVAALPCLHTIYFSGGQHHKTPSQYTPLRFRPAAASLSLTTVILRDVFADIDFAAVPRLRVLKVLHHTQFAPGSTLAAAPLPDLHTLVSAAYFHHRDEDALPGAASLTTVTRAIFSFLNPRLLRHCRSLECLCITNFLRASEADLAEEDLPDGWLADLAAMLAQFPRLSVLFVVEANAAVMRRLPAMLPPACLVLSVNYWEDISCAWSSS